MPNKNHLHLKKKSPKTKNMPLEVAMLVVAIVEPLMTIPQIVDLYSHPGNGRVSLVTWTLYLVAAAMWLIYGLYYRNRPLVLTGVLWILMDAMVVVGVLL